MKYHFWTRIPADYEQIHLKLRFLVESLETQFNALLPSSFPPRIWFWSKGHIERERERVRIRVMVKKEPPEVATSEKESRPLIFISLSLSLIFLLIWIIIFFFFSKYILKPLKEIYPVELHMKANWIPNALGR